MQQPHSRSQGFTLLELMISITVIAIIASIAVPNYIYSRATANEAVVVGTLRAIATAEVNFKTMGMLDADRTSTYEYGRLAELASISDIRGTTDQVTPPLLSASLGNMDAAGRVLKRGYYFALYLPDATGNGLADTAGNLGNIDPRMAENYWSCLAWPVQVDASGRATFFINQQGEILKTSVAGYSGTASVPPAGAALLGVPANRIDSTQLAVNVLGADGNQWISVVAFAVLAYVVLDGFDLGIGVLFPLIKGERNRDVAMNSALWFKECPQCRRLKTGRDAQA